MHSERGCRLHTRRSTTTNGESVRSYRIQTFIYRNSSEFIPFIKYPKPLSFGSKAPAPEILPHVYTSSATVQGNVLSMFGSKYMLPIGTTREDKEVYIIVFFLIYDVFSMNFIGLWRSYDPTCETRPATHWRAVDSRFGVGWTCEGIVSCMFFLWGYSFF